MKKLISLLIVLAMALTLAAPAAAVDSAKAGTMRMESTEGTVAVKNASGLSVKLKDKMRLYSGYTVKTESSSYAYISLDGDKTLKLDASSEASVSKSGKKLEIALISGSLFFNVTKPLKTDESLNIRTSTMMTGVRGTSACISAPHRDCTEITLLTGHLEVSGRDSGSDRAETIELSAGEHLTVTRQAEDTEGPEMQKAPARESDLPGFAAVEVAKDPNLQSRIAAETVLSVRLIVEDAPARLTRDEAAAKLAAEEVRREQQRQEQAGQQTGVAPVFKPVESSAGDSDDDDDEASAPSPTPDPEPVTSVSLDNPTLEVLRDALANAALIAVSVTNANITTGSGGPALEIPAGKTLNLNSGALEVSGGTLASSGTLTVSSDSTLTVSNSGALTNGGALTVSGGLTVTGRATLTNSGSLTVNDSLTVENGGGLTSGNALTVTGGGAVTVSGSGSLTNNGTLTFGGNTMTIENGSTLTNGGTIQANSGDVIVNGGTLDNSGTLTTASGNRLIVQNSGTLENSGELRTESGSRQCLESASTLNSNGTLTLAGEMNVQDPGTSLNILDAGKYSTDVLSGTLNLAYQAALNLASTSYTKELAVNGTLNASGTNTVINVGEGGSNNVRCILNGTLALASEAQLNVAIQSCLEDRGTLLAGSSGEASLDSTGTLNNQGYLTVYDTLEVSSGSTLTNSGELTIYDNAASFVCEGTLNNGQVIDSRNAMGTLQIGTGSTSADVTIVGPVNSLNGADADESSSIVLFSGSTLELMNLTSPTYIEMQSNTKLRVPSSVTVTDKTPGNSGGSLSPDSSTESGLNVYNSTGADGRTVLAEPTP